MKFTSNPTQHPIGIFNDSGICIDFTDEFTAIFGYETGDDFIGNSWSQLFITPKWQDIMHEFASETFAQSPQQFGATCATKDATRHPLTILLSRLQTGYFVCQVIPFADARYQASNIPILEYIEAIPSATSPKAIYDILVAFCNNLTSIDDAAVYKKVPNQREFRRVDRPSEDVSQCTTVPDKILNDAAFWDRFKRRDRVSGKKWEIFAFHETVPERRGYVLEDNGILVLSISDPTHFSKDFQIIRTILSHTNFVLNQLVLNNELKSVQSGQELIRNELSQKETVLNLFLELMPLISYSRNADAIKSMSCELVTRVQNIDFAWFANVTEDPSRLLPVSKAGNASKYLENVDLSMRTSPLPASKVAKTKEPVSLNATTEAESEDWKRELKTRNVTEIISIPIQIENVFHGILTLHSQSPNTLKGVDQEVLSKLGEFIGGLISLAYLRESLLQRSKTILGIEISDNMYPWIRVASVLSCEYTLQSAIPTESGTIGTIYVPDSVATEVNDLESLPIVSEVSPGDSKNSFHVQLLRNDISKISVEFGGLLLESTIGPSQATHYIAIPNKRTKSQISNQIVTAFPESRLLTLHEGDGFSPELFEIFDSLTTRQYEILHEAYKSGYFEWPRSSNLDDLAKSFDIATATASEHLRTS